MGIVHRGMMVLGLLADFSFESLEVICHAVWHSAPVPHGLGSCDCFPDIGFVRLEIAVMAEWRSRLMLSALPRFRTWILCLSATFNRP